MDALGLEVHVAGDQTPAYPASGLPDRGVNLSPQRSPVIPWLYRLIRDLEPDVVHANWLPSYPFLAALLRVRPLIAMAWGSDVLGAPPAVLRRDRYAIRRADFVLSDSVALQRRLVELGADPARCDVVNWGVDLSAFSPIADRRALRTRMGLPEDVPVVLSPRALKPLYNPDVIIDAYRQVRAHFPEAQLLMKHLGDVPISEEMRRDPGIHWIGHVDYSQMADYFRAADVCVSIPSTDSSPRSVWEAMACGVPVILSDLAWTQDLLRDGVEARLVAPEARSVANAICELLADPARAKAQARRARAFVEEHRDEEREMSRLIDIYERVQPSART